MEGRERERDTKVTGVTSPAGWNASTVAAARFSDGMNEAEVVPPCQHDGFSFQLHSDRNETPIEGSTAEERSSVIRGH